MTTSRKRVTNHELLKKYQKRKEAVSGKIDRAILKVVRASAFLTRVRNENQYVIRRCLELTVAIEKGEEYPKERLPKKRKGRVIEL